jgi:hypothetical protein
MNLKELHSFKLSDAVTFHDKLNPKLWIGVVLRPEVKDQLMTIAQDFLEELGVHDLDVKDITISGSNAAYSYTKHSDLDLHILVDMGNLPVDEVYRELFTAKKTIYNDTHDIKIHGIPVELYVQDSRQPVVSLGEYSVMHDKWLRIPSKRRSNFDQTSTKSKYEKLLGLIEIALQSKKYSKVKHIIDTIKRYRQAGLDKGGEFGPENLAYKMLRSQGYITKLYELRDKLHSEKLSFETMYQDIDEEYSPMQFAAEKTPAINPYGGLKDNQYRGAMSEAVTDNYLYHSIESIDTFRKIINTGEIKPKTPIEYEGNDIEMPVISASRNQYYRFPYGGGNIQFVIDKDALKHSGFKVKPYSYAQHYAPTKSTSNNELHKQETEEQILPLKGHGIPVKQPYIVGIQINPKFKDTPELEEIEKLSKSVNIPVSFMKTANKPAAKKVDIKLTPKFDPNRFVISPATGATKQYFPMMMYDKETKTTYGLNADYTNADINNRLKDLSEASGYIPNEKQKNDPRFKTALTVDVHPDSIKKNAKAFYWNTSRAGIPPTANANGKI